MLHAFYRVSLFLLHNKLAVVLYQFRETEAESLREITHINSGLALITPQGLSYVFRRVSILQ